MSDYFFPYFGPLLGCTTVSKEQLKDLKKICNKRISHHKNLAGHFKEEWLLDCEKYHKIILPQLQSFKGLYKKFYNRELASIKPTTVWVNHMKAGDFNPPHIHTNCRFSSVLFLKVPKELKEEANRFEGTSGGPGFISFRYGEDSGRDNTNIWAKLPEEGDMFIFPYFMVHWVFPFKTKNIERVSIAANYD